MHEKETMELKDGINYIKCHNCGASIDVCVGECNYCHSKNNYLQEWIMVKKGRWFYEISMY